MSVLVKQLKRLTRVSSPRRVPLIVVVTGGEPCIVRVARALLSLLRLLPFPTSVASWEGDTDLDTLGEAKSFIQMQKVRFRLQTTQTYWTRSPATAADLCLLSVVIRSWYALAMSEGTSAAKLSRAYIAFFARETHSTIYTRTACCCPGLNKTCHPRNLNNSWR